MYIAIVPRYKLSGLGRREFRVAGPLVQNSIADCLRDPALELASFKRQLNAFLCARYSTQRIERIRDAMTMCYINLLFAYLLTYQFSGNVEMYGEFGRGQRKVMKKARSQGNVSEFMWSGKFDCGRSTKCW